MKYRLKIDNDEYVISSSQELKQHLSFAYSLFATKLEFTLLPDNPRKPGLMTRILSSIMKLDIDLVWIENELFAWKQGNDAVLFYLEYHGDDFHSLNPCYTGDNNEILTFRACSGEQLQYPKSWTVKREQADEAFFQFYENGLKPQNLCWKKLEYEIE